MTKATFSKSEETGIMPMVGMSFATRKANSVRGIIRMRTCSVNCRDRLFDHNFKRLPVSHSAFGNGMSFTQRTAQFEMGDELTLSPQVLARVPTTRPSDSG